MNDTPLYVFDASAGVKWFKDETGSPASRSLFERGASGDARLAAPTHFVHEVLSVVRREFTYRAVTEAWDHLRSSGLMIVELNDVLVREAAAQCETLGCSFYDALAPACAKLLDATLVSADARAHGAFPGARII